MQLEFTGEINEFLRFVRCRRRGLLNNYMLAGFQSPTNKASVSFRRRDDRDDIDIRCEDRASIRNELDAGTTRLKILPSFTATRTHGPEPRQTSRHQPIHGLKIRPDHVASADGSQPLRVLSQRASRGLPLRILCIGILGFRRRLVGKHGASRHCHSNVEPLQRRRPLD